MDSSRNFGCKQYSEQIISIFFKIIFILVECDIATIYLAIRRQVVLLFVKVMFHDIIFSLKILLEKKYAKKIHKSLVNNFF